MAMMSKRQLVQTIAVSAFVGLYNGNSVASFSILPPCSVGNVNNNGRMDLPSCGALRASTAAASPPGHPVATTTTSESVAAPGSFIERELRGAAMRLHTKQQAPREGQAPSKPMKPHVTTHDEYLAFLVDSQRVYVALEKIVNTRRELADFRNSGLERTIPLEKDIRFMMAEYGLERPPVGEPGRKYAKALEGIESVPEFVCHYYNFYFAHTAGGRMIGKQMSALLLNKKTLEFYKWDGDLNEIKASVKEIIEDMAARWTPAERKECVDATAAAFIGGGAINSHLSGGQSSH